MLLLSIIKFDDHIIIIQGLNIFQIVVLLSTLKVKLQFLLNVIEWSKEFNRVK